MIEEPIFSSKEDIADSTAKAITDCNENDYTMASQILYRANKYLNIEWDATTANLPGGVTDQDIDIGVEVPAGSDPIKYPAGNYWVKAYIDISTTNTNIGMPYKWCGFTHYNDFIDLVNENKYTGDISIEWPYESIDDHVIGIDCSGLVSRAWNRSSKYFTGNLNEISAVYTNDDFYKLNRGDLLLKPGHAILVNEDLTELSITIDVIEAISEGVTDNTIVISTLQEIYTPRHYIRKLPYDLQFKNFEITEANIVGGGTLNISVDIENLGEQDFLNGNFRALVYENFADENSDDLGNSVFQVGEAVNTSVNGLGGTTTINFSLDEVPSNITTGDYLIAIEYERITGCWPQIPRNDFEAVENISITNCDFIDLNITADESTTDPFNIEFINLSTGTCGNWQWDFGDGTTSTEEHPTHTYNQSGSFNVSLAADGCTQTLVKQDYINIIPPYIKEVKIINNTDGTITYLSRRNYIDDAFSFLEVNYRKVYEADDLEILVITSLPLKNLKMEIYNQDDISVYNAEILRQGDNHTKDWSFIIPADKLPKGLYNIGFSGKDYIDEDLIKKQEPDFAPLYIDLTGTGWSIYTNYLQGIDDNYYFTVRPETLGEIDDYLYFSMKKETCSIGASLEVRMYNFHDNLHRVYVDGVQVGSASSGGFATFTLERADNPYKITVIEQRVIDGYAEQILVYSRIIGFSN